MNITFDLALGSTIFCLLGLLFSLAAARDIADGKPSRAAGYPRGGRSRRFEKSRRSMNACLAC